MNGKRVKTITQGVRSMARKPGVMLQLQGRNKLDFHCDTPERVISTKPRLRESLRMSDDDVEDNEDGANRH